jgi:hypothetical protein
MQSTILAASNAQSLLVNANQLLRLGLQGVVGSQSTDLTPQAAAR